MSCRTIAEGVRLEISKRLEFERDCRASERGLPGCASRDLVMSEVAQEPYNLVTEALTEWSQRELSGA
jgi:hypothetical protein